MTIDLSFGYFLKNERLKVGIGLRPFARIIGLQPSNLSNIEHGRLKPPQDRIILENIAEVLGFEKDSKEWKKLFDFSAKDNKKILPADIEEFLGGIEGIPILFREIKDKNLTDKDIKSLTEYIRSHYSK